MTDWRPIETVLQHLQECENSQFLGILVYATEHEGGEPAVCAAIWNDLDGGWWALDQTGHHQVYPTHWMPYPEGPEPPISEEILSTPIYDLELSIRSANVLDRLNVKTVGNLVALTAHDLLRVENFGRKSLNEVRGVLASMGLRLADDEKTQAPIIVLAWKDSEASAAAIRWRLGKAVDEFVRKNDLEHSVMDGELLRLSDLVVIATCVNAWGRGVVSQTGIAREFGRRSSDVCIAISKFILKHYPDVPKVKYSGGREYMVYGDERKKAAFVAVDRFLAGKRKLQKDQRHEHF